MGSNKFKLTLEYIYGPDHEGISRAKEPKDVFHAGTPGTLSLKELDEIVDLGQWRLKLGQRLVQLKVKKAFERSSPSIAADVLNRT